MFIDIGVSADFRGALFVPMDIQSLRVALAMQRLIYWRNVDTSVPAPIVAAEIERNQRIISAAWKEHPYGRFCAGEAELPARR